MSNNEKEKLLDHDYDGIQELDNPLPGWWLATFYGSIIFAAIYWVYYHLAGGPTLDQELAKEMEAAKVQAEAVQAAAPQAAEVDWNTLFNDKQTQTLGASVYQGKCLACHGAKGEGLIGPNLTDEYWIHGDGTIKGLEQVIAKGVPEKGMPPWESVISSDELKAVTVYLKSLIGSNPPNAKAPQGDKKEISL